jgi:cation diffusion facilitator family transporter
MVALLMAVFLRHVPRTEARAAISSLSAASALLILKFVAYFFTNSSVIFSDALDSIANVVAAAFALYSLDLAHRPADADHPYGHGKIEFLSAGFEGSMVMTAAVLAVIRAIDAIIHRSPVPEHLTIGLALLALALIVNGTVGVGLVRVGRRAQSATLEADGHHLLSDALISVAAIAGLLLVRLTGWRYVDPIAGLIVGVYIGYMGVTLMRVAIAGLMDQQDAGDERLLRRILDSHVGADGAEPRICSYHKLRHRHSGRYHWVDFHIVVPEHWDVKRGHQVASTIEYEIEKALTIGNATAHIEPCQDEPCNLCRGESSGG